MSMSINPLTSWRMQAQFWRTRRGRGGAGRGEGCHPFFPFSLVFHHFISFVVLLYGLQKKKPVSVKHRLRTVVFTVQEAFTSVTWRHQIQTKKLLILLSFYFHEVLQHLKNLYFHEFSVPKVSSFSIEHAWISRLLGDAAFSWCWPGKFLCG